MKRAKTPQRETALCGTCDTTYYLDDAEAVKVHQHPEPQSGEPRDMWLKSNLPYERWIKETAPGRAWASPKAFLCLVTWPDGSSGLLFPRPGNVPIATTREAGEADFETACLHLKQYCQGHKARRPISVRLVEFHRITEVRSLTIS